MCTESTAREEGRNECFEVEVGESNSVSALKGKQIKIKRMWEDETGGLFKGRPSIREGGRQLRSGWARWMWWAHCGVDVSWRKVQYTQTTGEKRGKADGTNTSDKETDEKDRVTTSHSPLTGPGREGWMEA